MRDASWRWVGIGLGLVLALSAWAAGARIVLTDGTVLEGTAIKQGDQYWIKTTDGQTRYVPAAQVKSVDAGERAAGPTTNAGTGGAGASPGSAAFGAAQRKAEAAETADAAVAIWEDYLKAAGEGAEQAAAKAELARWKVLAEARTEKINGKWVGGSERDAIVEKANKLYAEAIAMARQSQTLAAQKKLEEALKVYPTGYEMNFDMGYLALARRSEDEAIKYFEQALRRRPASTEAMLNISIAQFRKRQFDKAIERAMSAAKIEDDVYTAVVLAMVAGGAPPTAQRSARGKEALESAKLLAAKYGVDMKRLPADVPPVPMKQGGPGGPAGAASASGTGFLIADDGLILTNRHVVQGFKKLTVLLRAGDERPAEVVVIDDKQDLALIRVKPKEGERLPSLQLSATDLPGEGAECTVLGYPMIDRLGTGVKVTRGIVSGNPKAGGADVLTDAKVNPGNSGGPILNRFGHVMAIVSMKSVTMGMEDSYGIGISAGQIRNFLAKQKVTVAPAEAGGTAMNAEEIAAKAKPATVCILATK